MTKPIAVLQPDLIERRERKFLLIWKDIPHWMVVDEDVVTAIRCMDGHHKPDEILNAVKSSYKGLSENLRGEILDLERELKRTGIAYKKKPKRRAISSKSILENVTINVTRRCNLRCTHCYVEDRTAVEESLTMSDIRRFLKEGEKYLGSNLNYAILGGEPLLKKELVLNIAEFGMNQDREVIVSTNGLLIDAEFAQKARDLDLVVQVSLEGSSPEYNDQIRGKGSFQRARRGIETLVENGAYTIISMVVQRSNVSDMASFFHFGKDMGVDEIRYIPLKIMGNARTKELEPVPYLELLFAIYKLIKQKPEAVDYLGRDYFTILKTTCSLSNRRLYCGTGLKTLLIDADGEVYPCPNHALPEFKCGNIHKKSFREIWLRSKILKQLRTAYDVDQINEICPECVVKYWCMGGCRGEAYENSGRLDSRPDRCGEIRKAIIEMFWILCEEADIVRNAERTEYF